MQAEELRMDATTKQWVVTAWEARGIEVHEMSLVRITQVHRPDLALVLELLADDGSRWRVRAERCTESHLESSMVPGAPPDAQGQIQATFAGSGDRAGVYQIDFLEGMLSFRAGLVCVELAQADV